MSACNGLVLDDDEVMFVDVQAENYKRKASKELINAPSMKIAHSSAQSNISNQITKSGSVNNDTWQMLKFTFEDEGCDFTNIPWPNLKKSLDGISKTWRFISLSSNHKAVTIKESDSKVILHFLTINTILIEDISVNISIKVLQESKNKGIIYNKFLVPIKEVTILELLKNQSVTEIKKIEKKDKDGKANSTGSVILIFNKSEIPDYVVIDQISVKVSKLNPRPMQCFHCMNFGHVEKRCLKLEVELCRLCFYAHDVNNECNSVCKNCNLNHRSNSKKCPSYLREIEILKFKEAGQIS